MQHAPMQSLTQPPQTPGRTPWQRVRAWLWICLPVLPQKNPRTQHLANHCSAHIPRPPSRIRVPAATSPPILRLPWRLQIQMGQHPPLGVWALRWHRTIPPRYHPVPYGLASASRGRPRTLPTARIERSAVTKEGLWASVARRAMRTYRATRRWHRASTHLSKDLVASPLRSPSAHGLRGGLRPMHTTNWNESLLLCPTLTTLHWFLVLLTKHRYPVL